MTTLTIIAPEIPHWDTEFSKLREENFLYVDKTALVYQLAKMGNPCFLSRPRRFGKSLLLSTLEAYFQGKRELFQGLAIEKLEQDWFEYPVLHMDLNAERYDSGEKLVNMLESQLATWENRYGVTDINPSYSIRFMTVIQKAFETTGRRVVILIDEYDQTFIAEL